MLSAYQMLVVFGQTAPMDNPVSWFASLGVFVPTAAILWYLYTDTRKDRDRYRDLVFEMLPSARDAIKTGALAQERLADAVESRLISEAELVRLRRLLDRALRREG